MASTSTAPTSDTADEGSSYHILKYDDNDVPIIEGLKEEILRGIYGYGFNKPSPIQQKGILPII